MSESLNYIEAYFTGQLSDAEKRQFEQQCEADHQFAEDVAFYITSRQAIREKLLEEKKLLWSDKEEQNLNRTTSSTPVKRIMFSRWVTYAAAACLILVLSLYFLNKPETPQQLANNFVKDNYDRLSLTMDASTDSLQTGIALYNKHDYHNALSYFRSVYLAHPDNNDAKMYMGIAYLQLKDYDNAIIQFDELAQKKLRVNNGLFFKAVVLIQRDKGNDRKEAKAVLEQVVQASLAGSVQAREWLKNWKD